MKHVLKLFVAGSGANAQVAIGNFNRFVETHLGGDAETEIIDILDQPIQARVHQVIATPLLVKLEPLPVRKVIGDLSNTDDVCFGLGIGARQNQSRPQNEEPVDG